MQPQYSLTPEQQHQMAYQQYIQQQQGGVGQYPMPPQVGALHLHVVAQSANEVHSKITGHRDRNTDVILSFIDTQH